MISAQSQLLPPLAQRMANKVVQCPILDTSNFILVKLTNSSDHTFLVSICAHHIFFPPEDYQVKSKSIFILLLCIGVGCLLVAIVAGAVLFWRRRQRERIFAVADGNIFFFKTLYMCLDLLNFGNIDVK